MKDLSADKTSNQNQSIIVLNYLGFLLALVFAIYGWDKYILNTATAIVLGVFALFFIINAIVLSKQKTQLTQRAVLEKKLNRKETLLKEVHHRVKNNLQTVSSLLSLQSRSVADAKIKGIIKSSQHRVVSMSMVHEMLYKRDDYTSKIDLKPYFEELCGYLIRSVKGNDNNITIKLDVGDYKLSIDTVIPLGLIVNETITNALKYGLPDDSSGEISIQLTKKGNNSYEMYLGDNGIGFPEDVSPKTSKSLGLKLIHNLAKQLRGTIARDPAAKGTYYQMTFEEVIEEFNSVDA